MLARSSFADYVASARRAERVAVQGGIVVEVEVQVQDLAAAQRRAKDAVV